MQTKIHLNKQIHVQIENKFRHLSKKSRLSEKKTESTCFLQLKIYADSKNLHVVRFRHFDENQFAINHKSLTYVISVMKCANRNGRRKKTFIFKRCYKKQHNLQKIP